MIRHIGLRATTYDIIGYLIPGIFDIGLFSIFLKVLSKDLFSKLVSLAIQFGWFRYIFVFAAIYAVGHLHSNAAKVFMKLVRPIPFLGPRLSPSWQSAVDNTNRDVFARIFRMHRSNVKLYNSVLVCSLINEHRKMEEDLS